MSTEKINEPCQSGLPGSAHLEKILKLVNVISKKAEELGTEIYTMETDSPELEKLSKQLKKTLCYLNAEITWALTIKKQGESKK